MRMTLECAQNKRRRHHQHSQWVCVRSLPCIFGYHPFGPTIGTPYIHFVIYIKHSLIPRLLFSRTSEVHSSFTVLQLNSSAQNYTSTGDLSLLKCSGLFHHRSSITPLSGLFFFCLIMFSVNIVYQHYSLSYSSPFTSHRALVNIPLPLVSFPSSRGLHLKQFCFPLFCPVPPHYSLCQTILFSQFFRTPTSQKP